MPKVALITGASSGLGVEFARLAAQDGFDILAVARSVDKMEALKRELEQRHAIAVHVLGCDLSEEGAARKVAAHAESLGVEIEVLVNNAGFGAAGNFVDEADWQRQRDLVQVNIVALMELMKAIMPAMARRGSGRVLNVASAAAMLPGPGMAAYYASKSFVRSFSEAVAAECAGTGVTVTALCLGPAATNWAAEAGLDAAAFNRGAASPQKVARAGWRAAKESKVLCYYGAVAKAGAVMERLAPRAALRMAGKVANSGR